jgi:hypothetical protein
MFRVLFLLSQTAIQTAAAPSRSDQNKAPHHNIAAVHNIITWRRRT